MRRIYTLLLVLLGLSAQAQFSISDDVRYDFATSDLGAEYFKPVGKVFSGLLNSGIFPRYSEEGFHIKVGLHVTRMSIFSGNMLYELSDRETAPNIAGPQQGVSYTDEEGRESTLPGGNNVNELILGAPELYIGTLVGTDFYGRYGQLGLDGNLGNLQFYGGGIRHDVGRYFLPEYVKWYLSYNYNQLKLGETVNTVSQYGLTQVGVKLNRIGFYGLFGMEINDSTLSYDFPGSPASGPTTIALADEFPFRYGGGFNLSFKYVDLYGEYNMNDPVALLVGFSVGI